MIVISNVKVPKTLDIGDKYTFQNDEYICRNIKVIKNKVYAHMIHCKYRELELLLYICEEKDYDFSGWEE